MSATVRRSAVLTLALVAAATGGLAAQASGQAPAAAGPGTITATGTATVKPTPADAHSSDSIAAAVKAAKAKALPRAITDARFRGQKLADAAGLKIGALISIADSEQSVYFGGSFFGPFGVDGTFGPGKFCGNVPQFKTTHLANGRITRKRIGTHRICRVPQVVETVSVTFATIA